MANRNIMYSFQNRVSRTGILDRMNNRKMKQKNLEGPTFWTL